MVSSTKALDPSLNTQSCIRRPLCSTFKFESLRSSKKERFYHVFEGKKKPFFLLKKFEKVEKTGFFRANTQISNLNVLHKGLLMQDWVFRLGVNSIH